MACGSCGGSGVVTLVRHHRLGLSLTDAYLDTAYPATIPCPTCNHGEA